MTGLPEFTLQHLMLNSAHRVPSNTAVIDGGTSYTFEELAKHSGRLARALKDCGVRPGDRIGIYMDKCWDSVVAMFGVASAGAAFVNVNPLLKGPQVSHIIKNCGIRVLIADPEKLSPEICDGLAVVFLSGARLVETSGVRSYSLASALSGRDEGIQVTPAIENDLCTVIYTSGSTGRPKGIMFSHHNVVVGAQIVSSYLQNTPDDRVLSVLPFSFDYGLNQLTTMVRVGGALVLQRSLLPGEILKSLRQHSVTGLAGVPPVWALLLQARRSIEAEPLPALRYITNSGGMIPGAHLEALRMMLPGTSIYLMYGLTEAFRSTFLHPSEIRRGSSCIGKAIPNTQVWVVDSNGKECLPGQTGELVHRGPTVSQGYWGEEELSRQVFKANPFLAANPRGADVVVYSGDLATRDEEGFIYFVGRKDELIKTQGYRVSPAEVEEILCSLPGVHEAAAFGVPDDSLGQAIVAVVSPQARSFLDVESLRIAYSARAPAYLVPRAFHILPELPKTPSGKIDRTNLRNEYAVAKNRVPAGPAQR